MALENADAKVLVNGATPNNLRYADDTAVFSDSLKGVQKLISRMVDASSEWNYLSISRKDHGYY